MVFGGGYALPPPPILWTHKVWAGLHLDTTEE